jgi:hypothetical protein
MRSADPYLAQREMEMRVGAELRQAEARGLANLARSAQRPSLSGRCRWLLCDLGYVLVVLGARLEAYALPPYRPLNGEAKRGS